MSFWKKIFFRTTREISSKDKKDIEFEEKISNLIGYMPTNWSVFHECFTHTSLNSKNFERLEFLGDSILGSIISDYLYQKAPEQNEGYLTQMRSKMVNRKKLNELGKQLKLTSLLHKKEKSSLGENIYGNLYEALVGAIYVDGGFESSRDFITETIINQENIEQLEKRITSYKGLILEWAQKAKINLTFNTFQEENAEDILIFNSIIRINEEVIAKGRATSKKKAEENAARRAYYSLHKHTKIK